MAHRARCASLLVLSVLLALGAGCRQVLGIEELALASTDAAMKPGDSGLPLPGAPEGGAPDASPVQGPERQAFQSCRGQTSKCGPSGSESCCAIRKVDAGMFFRGGGLMDFPASVSPFLLDRFEVTVSRMEAFVESGYGTQQHPPAPGAGAHPLADDGGWDPAWNGLLAADSAALRAALSCNSRFDVFGAGADADPNRAANCVDWHTAFAFCIWDGGRLPTETEWEYAAAGGPEQRTFPWGNDQPDADHAKYGCVDCSLRDILPVGSLPAGDGRWGHADLAGNLYEWVLDVFGEQAMSCADCANLGEGATRVVKGGSFLGAVPVLRNSHRTDVDPTASTPNGGVRCARDL